MRNDGYPSDWDSRRQQVYRRDGYKCQNCGRKGNPEGNAQLHAHHVVPKSKGGTHSISNLTTVCKECHKAIHNNSPAPEAKDDSYEFASIPSEVTSLNDLQEILAEILLMRGSHPASTSISDLQKIRETRTKDNLDIAQSQEPTFNNSKTKDIFQNSKNKIMRLKSAIGTADPSDFSQPEDVQNIVSLTTETLGIIMEYINNVEEYESLMQSVKCSECGEPESVESSFCGNCGSELPIVWKCSDCENTVDTLSNDFCTSCGNEIDGFTEDQERRINELHKEATELWNRSTQKIEDIAGIAAKIN